MPVHPKKDTDRPEWWSFDAMLSGMSVHVGVASRTVANADCAVTFPPGDGRLKFCYFEAGTAWVSVGEGTPQRAEAGEWWVLPNGREHTVYTNLAEPPITIHSFLDRLQMPCASGLNYVFGQGDLKVSMISGWAEIAQWRTHPIWRNLPDMIAIPANQVPQIGNLLTLIAEEASHPKPGSRAIIDRLAEVAIMYSVRYRVEQSGVLAASLFDPEITRVLIEVHGKPDRHWTLEAMSHLAGLSRSSFVERFQKVIGRAPGEYLTTWRMHFAGQLLREQKLSVGEAALAVGYASEAAFARAFRREVGESPGHYRSIVA